MYVICNKSYIANTAASLVIFQLLICIT